MCTLILKKPSNLNASLQIFGNRDERLDRAAGGFCEINIEKTRIWAPRDLEKGGTWLGVNEHGLFAGLTNRYAPDGYPHADPACSRGEIPHAALACRNVDEAMTRLRELTTQSNYPGFHLVVCHHQEARLLIWDGTMLHERPVQDDTMVITERSFAGSPPQREVSLRSALSQLDHELSLEDVTSILSRHELNSIDAVCVHLDGINYGTRSAVCINLGRDLKRIDIWESDSPPCRANWRKVELGVKRGNDT